MQPRQPRAPVQPTPPGYPPGQAPPPGYAQGPPLPPEREPWSEGPWPAILAAVVALLVGGAIGYAIGNSGGSSGGEHSAATVTHTTTVTHPTTVVQTHTVTASTVKETPASNQPTEEKLREAEANLKTLERENKELHKRLEEAGASP